MYHIPDIIIVSPKESGPRDYNYIRYVVHLHSQFRLPLPNSVDDTQMSHCLVSYKLNCKCILRYSTAHI